MQMRVNLHDEVRICRNNVLLRLSINYLQGWVSSYPNGRIRETGVDVARLHYGRGLRAVMVDQPLVMILERSAVACEHEAEIVP